MKARRAPARSAGKHVAVYVRVSTDEQTTANQLRQLEPAMRRAGLTSWVVYEDAGVSGASAHSDRPGMKRLLEAVGRGEVAQLWTWAHDRLGRSLQAHAALLDALHSAGVELYTLAGKVDWQSPQGRFLVSMVAAVAEFERGLLVDRTKAGIATARANGVHVGRPKAAAARAIMAEVMEGETATTRWTPKLLAWEVRKRGVAVSRSTAARFLSEFRGRGVKRG